MNHWMRSSLYLVLFHLPLTVACHRGDEVTQTGTGVTQTQAEKGPTATAPGQPPQAVPTPPSPATARSTAEGTPSPSKPVADSGTAAASPPQVVAEEDPSGALLKSEGLGGIKLDLPAKDVVALVGCAAKKGKEQLSEATGDVTQTWDFPGCGVSATMISATKGGNKRVGDVLIKAPSTLTTAKNIGIGSGEQEVLEAYRAVLSKEEGEPGKTVVAGSLYGGLVFRLSAGKVTSIFLGAAAE